MKEMSPAIKIWIQRNKLKFKNDNEELLISEFLVSKFNNKHSINFNYEQCLEKYSQHKEINSNTEITNFGKTKVVFNLPDGFTLVSLLDQRSKEWESEQMRNCLSGDDYLYKDGIYSIRSPLNESICTLEIKNNELLQILGKFNSTINENYFNHVVFLLKSEFFDNIRIKCTLDAIGLERLVDDDKFVFLSESFTNLNFIKIKEIIYFNNKQELFLKENIQRKFSKNINVLYKNKKYLKNITQDLEFIGRINKLNSEMLEKRTFLRNKKTKLENSNTKAKSFINSFFSIYNAGLCLFLTKEMLSGKYAEATSAIRVSYPSKWNILLKNETKRTVSLITNLINKKQMTDSDVSDVFRTMLKLDLYNELFFLIKIFYKNNSYKKTVFLLSSIFIKSKNKLFRNRITNFFFNKKNEFIFHENDYFFEKILAESSTYLFLKRIKDHEITYNPFVLLKYTMYFGNLNLLKFLIKKHEISKELQKRAFLRIVGSFEERVSENTFKNGVFDFLIKNNPDFLLYENSSIYIELRKELKYKKSKLLIKKIDELYSVQLKEVLDKEKNNFNDINDFIENISKKYLISLK